MKDLTRSMLNVLSWPFAILLLAFTGYQTYTLIYAVTGSHLMAVIGLVLFEIGMLYWWAVFRHDAEGLPQMAVSLLVFLACLSFVVLATALKLGAVGEDVMGEGTPAKIITAAAVIQLAAKLFFPLLHPDVLQTIKERVQEGKIINAADAKFDKRVDGIADEYTDALVEERTNRLFTKLNTKHHTRYQLGGAAAPVVIEGQAADADTSAAPRRSWRDRLRGRQSDPVPVVVNSTHDTPAARLEPLPGKPLPGQGQGGAPRLSAEEIAAIADVLEARRMTPPANGAEANGGTPRP